MNGKVGLRVVSENKIEKLKVEFEHLYSRKTWWTYTVFQCIIDKECRERLWCERSRWMLEVNWCMPFCEKAEWRTDRIISEKQVSKVEISREIVIIFWASDNNFQEKKNICNCATDACDANEVDEGDIVLYENIYFRAIKTLTEETRFLRKLLMLKDCSQITSKSQIETSLNYSFIRLFHLCRFKVLITEKDSHHPLIWNSLWTSENHCA